MHKANK